MKLFIFHMNGVHRRCSSGMGYLGGYSAWCLIRISSVLTYGGIDRSMSRGEPEVGGLVWVVEGIPFSVVHRASNLFRKRCAPPAGSLRGVSPGQCCRGRHLR